MLCDGVGRFALNRSAMRSLSSMFVNAPWLFPATVPVEMPIGLSHLDSDFCWCDPIIETDQHGEEIAVHLQVTWN
jgi:hypothetical protein